MDWVLFVDDGGVMNDNALRGSQWQRLLGKFFPPILGGTPEAWAEANRIVGPRLWEGYGLSGQADVDYAAYDRVYRTAWLGGMCWRSVSMIRTAPGPPSSRSYLRAGYTARAWQTSS